MTSTPPSDALRSCGDNLPVAMAEPRRVALTTLSSDVPAPSDKQHSPHKTPSGVCQVKENCPEPPAESDTVRLVLTLFEPDDRSFPEFSYSELIDNKINHTNDKVTLSRFEEEEKRENDEVAAIAKKLEEKYGGKPKKKDRIQDLIDIGYGYDDEDSFIDNSEAYDEFVPASITTRFGGFYVNSGVLQFRQASETETDTEDFTTEEKRLEHSKKRKLNDGSDKPKKKRCRESEEKKNNMDSKESAGMGPNDELKKKKKKKAVGTLSVTSMLKKFQREKEKERQKMKKAALIVREPSVSLCPADAAGGGGSGFTDPLLSLIGSTNDHTLIQAASTVDFDIDLDSLLDVSEETSLPQPTVETQLVQPADDRNQLISSVKAKGQNTKTNLHIELQCREQGAQVRSKVYTHLSSFLPCSRDTLVKRVKKLLIAHTVSVLDVPLNFYYRLDS
uniref:Ubinuclein 1 n=1 Tax=Anabas testudineus TaxID=64144 RepID=A0A3Q1HEE4_ANATE